MSQPYQQVMEGCIGMMYPCASQCACVRACVCVCVFLSVDRSLLWDATSLHSEWLIMLAIRKATTRYEKQIKQGTHKQGTLEQMPSLPSSVPLWIELLCNHEHVIGHAYWPHWIMRGQFKETFRNWLMTGRYFDYWYEWVSHTHTVYSAGFPLHYSINNH